MLERPVCFLATTHPDAAREFYADVLGLELISDEPFALVFDLQGTELRIQKVREVPSLPYTSLGWRVEDVRSEIARLVERGVRMERFDGIAQDEDGVWTAPGGTSVAWFRDPDGQLLSITG